MIEVVKVNVLLASGGSNTQARITVSLWEFPLIHMTLGCETRKGTANYHILNCTPIVSPALREHVDSPSFLQTQRPFYHHRSHAYLYHD